MSDTDKLTNEQAAAMLAQLGEYFGSPVMPIQEYCHALQTWADIIRDRDGWNGSDLSRAVSEVETAIRKSSLLARLLYEGEPLRTKKCPIHNGRWSGIGVCEHGCGETGWIPEGWPDSAPRCTRHPDRPAVGSTVSINGATDDCFECHVEKWPALAPADTRPPTTRTEC